MKQDYQERIVIIGGVGTAINIIEQIADAREKHSMSISVEGVIIDTVSKGSLIGGVPVLGGMDDMGAVMKNEQLSFIFAMYKQEKMKERYLLFQQLNIPEGRLANFIHPKAYLAPSVKLGRGNVILSNTSVNSNVEIGTLNIIKT
jgi:acetyltransferase EpsM